MRRSLGKCGTGMISWSLTKMGYRIITNHRCWAAFGVGEMWLLLVSPICGLVSLYLTRYLATLLWPNDQKAIRLAPWFLFGTLLWGAFLNSAMFDTLLTACVLLAMSGLVKAARECRWQSWALFALGCGLGLLAKGPVVFVNTLIPFLSGILWSESAKNQPKRWYLYGSVAITGGILLALLWAVPAILSAGDKYGFTLLWHQTVDRVSNSFAHKRPVWWYLMLSPILLFPWFFWPRAWQCLFDREKYKDNWFRFCAIWFGSGIIAFSFISGKQVHYLIPLFPALALMLSKSLADQVMPVRPTDYLPYAVIAIFGAVLLILPQLHDLKLYHWLQDRKLWWAVLILITGLGAIGTIAYTGSISPYQMPMTVILALVFSLAGFFSSTGNAFHLRQAAQTLDGYLAKGDPIAWAGKYDGQLQFLLRLDQPMTVIDGSESETWLTSHRNGHVISIERGNKIGLESFCNDYWQYYREDKLCVRSIHQRT